jgi:hypothetical protein
MPASGAAVIISSPGRQVQRVCRPVALRATSPSQLKTLWTKVGELLSAEPTQLERDALAIVPLDASGD